MSGSRDHFSNKLRQELQSALALLMKSLAHQAVDLTLPVTLCVMITAINADSHAAPVRVEPPAHHAVGAFGQALPTRALALAVEARLSAADRCHIEPAIMSAPMLEAMSPPLHAIGFAELAPAPSRALPVEALAIPGSRGQDTLSPSPASRAWNEGPKLQSRAHTLPMQGLRQRSRGMPGPMFALPVRKSPIPPHRFPIALRNRFKRALAEKHGTFAANIQLGVAFDRMDMTLYSSISQDEQGHLLCHPRPELLGASLAPRNRFGSSPAYLVFGTRLDTGENLKALVPVIVEPVEDAHEP